MSNLRQITSALSSPPGGGSSSQHGRPAPGLPKMPSIGTRSTSNRTNGTPPGRPPRQGRGAESSPPTVEELSKQTKPKPRTSASEVLQLLQSPADERENAAIPMPMLEPESEPNPESAARQINALPYLQVPSANNKASADTLCRLLSTKPIVEGYGARAADMTPAVHFDDAAIQQESDMNGKSRLKQAIAQVVHEQARRQIRKMSVANLAETVLCRNRFIGGYRKLCNVREGSASSVGWFTSDGEILALGRVGQKCVTFHSLTTQQTIVATECPGRITASAVSQSGRLMCVGCDTGMLRVHMLNRGHGVGTASRSGWELTDSYTAAPNSTAQPVAWQTNLNSRVSDAGFTIDCNLLGAVEAGAGTITIFDAWNGAARCKLQFNASSAATTENVLSESILRFSATLLVARGGRNDSRRIKVWRVPLIENDDTSDMCEKSCVCEQDCVCGAWKAFSPIKTLSFSHEVVAVAVSANSRNVAVSLDMSDFISGMRLDIEVFQVTSADRLDRDSQLLGEDDHTIARQLQFNPSGTQLAAARVSGKYEIYDITKMCLCLMFKMDPCSCPVLCFSPLGNLLAAGGDASKGKGVKIVQVREVNVQVIKTTVETRAQKKLSRFNSTWQGLASMDDEAAVGTSVTNSNSVVTAMSRADVQPVRRDRARHRVHRGELTELEEEVISQPSIRRVLVRNIGEELENAELLTSVFSDFGEVKAVFVRHRVDVHGKNTSWALVAMEEAGCAAALAATVMYKRRVLSVVRFVASRARSSKGAMQSILKTADKHIEELRTDSVGEVHRSTEDSAKFPSMTACAVSFSHIASCYSTRVVVHSRANAEELFAVHLCGPGEKVESARPSNAPFAFRDGPTCDQLACIVAKKRVVVLSVPSGEELFRPNISDGMVSCVAFSGDGKLLLVGGTFGVQMFDVHAQRPVECLPDLGNVRKCIVKGRYLVVSHADSSSQKGGVLVYQLEDKRLLYQFGQHGCDVAIDTAGKRIAYLEYRVPGCTVVDLETGEQLHRWDDTPPGLTLCFSTSAKSEFLMCVERIAGSWSAGRITLYNTITGEQPPYSELLRPMLLPPEDCPGHAIGFVPAAPHTAQQSDLEELYAGIKGAVFIADIRHFLLAAQDGAFSAQQLVWLTEKEPSLIPVVASKWPNRINLVRDDECTAQFPKRYSCGMQDGDSVVHFCVKASKGEELAMWMEPAAYVPLTDLPTDAADKGQTALTLSILRHDYKMTSLLLHKLTNYISEQGAESLTFALKVLAQEMPQLCLHFLQTIEKTVCRTLVSFRTTYRRPEVFGFSRRVLPSLGWVQMGNDRVHMGFDQYDDTADAHQLRGAEAGIPQIWSERNVFPASGHGTWEKVLVESKVVLLADLLSQESTDGVSPFHTIVEHCRASVFNSRILQRAVQYKWEHNVRVIFRVHFVMRLLFDTVLSTAAMLLSSRHSSQWAEEEASFNINAIGSSTGLTPTFDYRHALYVHVAVGAMVAAQLGVGWWEYRQRRSKAGTYWQYISMIGVWLLLLAAVAHFADQGNAPNELIFTLTVSGGPGSTDNGATFVETFGGLGVMAKWIALVNLLRVFKSTGWLVRMIEVTCLEMKEFFLILIIWVLAGVMFFSINTPNSPLFDTTVNNVMGPLWPVITMFTWSFAEPPEPSKENELTVTAHLVAVAFSFFVLVVLMNLLIAIMTDSYQKVKSSEFVEDLHGRARLIVDMEQQFASWFTC